MEFKDARASCQELGGDLATIENVTEQTFIVNQLDLVNDKYVNFYLLPDNKSGSRDYKMPSVSVSGCCIFRKSYVSQ